jgi:hypothetical protein
LTAKEVGDGFAIRRGRVPRFAKPKFLNINTIVCAKVIIQFKLACTVSPFTLPDSHVLKSLSRKRPFVGLFDGFAGSLSHRGNFVQLGKRDVAGNCVGVESRVLKVRTWTLETKTGLTGWMVARGWPLCW